MYAEGEYFYGRLDLIKRILGNIWIWLLFVGVALCSTLYFTFLKPGITDCWLRECPPKRGFHVLNLDIPKEFFPENAIVNALYDNDNDNLAIEAGNKTVYWNEGNGLAIYTVERFRTQEDALRRFGSDEWDFENNFSSGARIDFESNLANQVITVCGHKAPFGFRCFFAAYYSEYYVYFNTYPDEEMSVEDFLKVVEYIDQMMITNLVEGK